MFHRDPLQEDSLIRNVDFDVERQFLSLSLSTFDKRPSNHGSVPPENILGGKDQAELELANQREQETLHPVQIKIVNDRDEVSGIDIHGLYERKLMPDARARSTEESHEVAPYPGVF